MTIRQLTVDEVPIVLPLGHEFEALIGDPIVHLVDEKFVFNWRQYISIGVGVILVGFDGDKPVGALSGYCVPADRSGELVAQETWWYVSPAARGTGLGRQLAEAFERYARVRGATWVSLGAIGHLPAVDGLLEKLGYRPFERTWFKIL